MSIEKKNTKQHGGWRKGAGAKPRIGGARKICVSVNKQTWQAAVDLWKEKPSWLVDGLLLRYMETGGGILKKEAAI